MPKIRKSDPSTNPTPILRKPKLWAVVVGINQYQDVDILNLNYCANDALGLGTALQQVALQNTVEREAIFETVEIRVHCDRFNSTSCLNSISTPARNNILASLDLFSQAQPQDTILFYFSGHGFYDNQTKNTILCLPSTAIDALSQTGLAIAQVVEAITNSPAKQQLIWLDACHSGGMASQLIDAILAATKNNPQIYAITACDRHQESLELPQLGHGLFTYHLIQGLQGGITNPVIKAEELYQHVYYKTLEYIDRTNQLSQLIEGNNSLNSFTPQRFAFGSGEFRLGLHSSISNDTKSRGALVIDGLNPSPMALNLSNSLANKGKFIYQPYGNKDESIRNSITALLRSPDTIVTLLYLKGRFEIIEELGVFRLDDGTKIPKEWLAQQIANSPCLQQVVIFDCSQTDNIKEQIESFKQPNKSQCIVAASTEDNWLGQKLTEIIDRNSAEGLTATNLINQISQALYQRGIFNSKQRSFYRSAPQGEIINVIYPQAEQTDKIIIDRNYCPYKGLEAFTDKDKDYFFGRDNLIREIISQLEKSSFLPVVGASGSGKSSVVQAGAIPLLLERGLFNSEDNLYKACQVWTLRTGDNPLRALALALSNENDTSDYLEGILNLGIPSFVAWLRQQSQPMGILFIDQFEELFTQASEVQRDLFLDLILGTVDLAGDRFKVIITLRSDFMASCLSLPQLGEKVKQNPIFVPSYLTEAEYRQIITQPATRVGLSIQPELVDVLISEVSQEKGALPLLEFTLEQLWLNRDRGFLSLQVYKKKIGGIKKVLQDKADRVYQTLNQSQKECAEWIFTQLVSLGEGQEDTRRRRVLSELVVPKYDRDLITSTLNLLQDSRLIVMSNQDGDVITSQPVKVSTKGKDKKEISQPLQLSIDSEVTVEIAHEILIRNWQQLCWWLDENREQIRLRERIEEKASEWKVNGQKTDYLIRGAALAQAEEFYIKSADELTVKSQEFIYQCIFNRDKEAKEKEARIQRELEQERKARLAAQTRTGVAIIATIIVSAVGIIANNQRLKAERQETISTLREKAARARNLLSRKPINGLLLAIQTTGESQDKFEKVLPSVQASLLEGVQLSKERILIDEVPDIFGENNQNLSLALSPDGNYIVSGWEDGIVRLWDMKGNLINRSIQSNRVETPHGIAAYGITAISFSPDGKYIASSSDGRLRLWDRKTNVMVYPRIEEVFEYIVHSIAFSPDGNYIVSGGSDGIIRLWDTKGNPVGQPFLGHQGSITSAVTSVAFSPDSNYIVSGGSDGTIRVWDVKENHISFSEEKISFTSVVFSPNGKYIVSGGQHGTIRLWNTKGNPIGQPFLGHEKWITSLAFSPDGKYVVSSSEDQTIRLWDIKGNPVGQPFFNRDDFVNSPIPVSSNANVTSVAFSPDGKYIVSGDSGGILRLWDKQGNPIGQPFIGHEKGIQSVAFSPDGKYIVIGGDGGILRLWDNEKNSIGRPFFPGHKNDAFGMSVAFSPDGKYIVSGDSSGIIKLWDKQGNPIGQPFIGHQDYVSAVAFSPDSKHIVSSSWDKTIRLWDKQGNLIGKPFIGHQDAVNSVGFSQDGRYIVSGGKDGKIMLWNGEWQSWLYVACNRLKHHSIFIKSLTEEVDNANKACLKHGGWSKTEKAQFLKKQKNNLVDEQ